MIDPDVDLIEVTFDMTGGLVNSKSISHFCRNWESLAAQIQNVLCGRIETGVPSGLGALAEAVRDL
jgi:hypothetical protein